MHSEFNASQRDIMRSCIKNKNLKNNNKNDKADIIQGES
jgi:hypothetical protein